MKSTELAMSSLHNADIRDALDVDWQGRIFNPSMEPYASEHLLATRAEWSGKNGQWPSTTAFTSGAYDLLHLDHCGYLVHTKALAAEHHFDKYYSDDAGVSWGDLDREHKNLWWREFLSNGELRLIVSVDGNSRIAARKSNNPDKGNSTRPVLDWLSRARAVSAFCIRATNSHPSPVADAVTIHDQFELLGTCHESLYDLAAFLQPDVWSVYSESTDILEHTPNDDRLGSIDVVCISEEENYFDDTLLGGRFNTTKILQRMSGAT